MPRDRFPRSISDAAIADARRLASEGVPRREIARRTGIAEGTISDVVRGTRRPDAPGAPVAEVGAAERERRRHVAWMAINGKAPPDWSLVDRLLGVESDIAIATALGVTPSAVSQRRARLGVARARRKPKVGGKRRGAGRPRAPAGTKSVALNLTVAPALKVRVVAAAAAAEQSVSAWMSAAAELALARGSTR